MYTYLPTHRHGEDVRTEFPRFYPRQMPALPTAAAALALGGLACDVYMRRQRQPAIRAVSISGGGSGVQ